MANAADRLLALKAQQATFTGIDFVQVVDVCDQTTLRIYFLTDIQALTRPIDSGAEAISHDDIIIFSPTGGAGVPIVQLDTNVPLTFGSDIEACRDFLEIKVLEPGDFTNYRLRINDPFANTDPLAAPFPRVDPFFNDVEFSFKAGCDDQLDCAPPGPDCPIEDQVDFPVDYLARDFVSFKNALLDFAAQRYPQWEQPTDADVGFMLMEVMAALGDEFSYIQDRHGREAYLETATERRSLRKKARLVDYEIHDGRLASTFLELTTSGATSGSNDGLVAAGSNVYALSDTMPAVVFEIGQGLRDTREYAVRDEWNGGALEPYVFDDSQQCLLIGATELFVAGTVLDSNLLVSEEPAEVRRMLLRTEPADPSVPARRILVRITEITEIFDPLFSQTVSRIRWHEDDALRFQLDQNELVISLNVLPATAGETLEAMFICAEIGVEPELPSAVEREGPLPRIGGERPTIFLFSLPGTDIGGLGFLGDDVRNTVPEIVLQEVGTGGNEWTWRRSLIGAAPTDEVFTLEDGTWRRIVAHRRLGKELVHRDYAVGTGYTIRFGDTEFGRPPSRGAAFEVLYRLGPGVFANVPAGAIRSLTRVDGSGRELPTFVTAASNPLAVIDGVNPESATDIKLLTPEAYRADVLFAVRPEDYGHQAERLPWVQRAQGTFRWTGSWLTAFVAADPAGAFTLSDERRAELEALMDCVRQAGREVIVVDPRFAPVDLRIHLCIEPFAHSGEVLGLVREALFGRRGARPTKGFFHPDNFTFGTPLRRSALEAAIHDVKGVRSVTSIEVRERGKTAFREMQELVFAVGPDEVLRIENDPLHPERGTVTFATEGGA